jgi:hypothetical protein
MTSNNFSAGSAPIAALQQFPTAAESAHANWEQRLDERFSKMEERLTNLQTMLTQVLSRIPAAQDQQAALDDVSAKASSSKRIRTFACAVVHWFNYRKDLSAGFLKGFDSLPEALAYAFARAEQDVEEYDGEKVIIEDQITDGNGPGKHGSPYAMHTIIGFGGRDPTGYSTTFYCVVPWFPGVMNEWSHAESEDYWEAKYCGEWYPEYEF